MDPSIVAAYPFVTLDDGSSGLSDDFLKTTVELYDVEGSAHEDAKEACIITPRLMLFSSGHSTKDNALDTQFIVKCFTNPHNMHFWGDTNPYTEDTCIEIQNNNCKDWREGNVFGSFIVDNHEGTNLGLTALADTDTPGTCEYQILIDKEFQNNKYGTEATIAMCYFWAPYLREHGYKVAGAPLEHIITNSHTDNTGLQSIVMNLGAKLVSTTRDERHYCENRNIHTFSVDSAKNLVERSLSNAAKHTAMKAKSL